MVRPVNKQELIVAAQDKFQQMMSLIGELDNGQKQVDFDWSNQKIGKEAHWERDKNIRDVIIHLFEWHKLLLNWVEANQVGEGTSFLPEPYNWRTYGQMNQEFFEKHQQTEFEEALGLVQKSHKQVMLLIDSFSDEALFTKKYFSWTGGSTLGSYCISATSSHYEWAIKKIKKHKKQLLKK
ncbi:ClbS/DfsB family four-helix bundle protein [Vagococcus vulneris]|uniref:ClbS/DfsB family four-helix bundle protein n=1 Tax=Vagococcus vulneris TaxID=1977869 RepID=A0A429ZRV0_9ENTE|nr:ClbS/DfsB family four-helix bundle protein [Vagococcus vulneris]RST96391.1 hypothetical protein CBF37_11105 [Vagococcus vulneris]